MTAIISNRLDVISTGDARRHEYSETVKRSAEALVETSPAAICT
jgi:hypothetical protein